LEKKRVKRPFILQKDVPFFYTLANDQIHQSDTKKGNALMLSLPAATSQQIPLIHEVYADDRYLLNTIEGEWFEILSELAWEEYVEVAAAYYDALYAFNQQAQSEADSGVERGAESPAQAKQRLLFDRATMQPGDAGVSILYQAPQRQALPMTVEPRTLAPGVVPLRLAGRKPKCFFSLLKSFIGAPLMGFAAEPEAVYLLLKSNPSFARVCGFVPREKAKAPCYHGAHIPSLRKLEQFDQVMSQAGLWDRLKRMEVRENLASGVIELEEELVGDTTHYLAHSSFETVAYLDEQGQLKKKSQSKLSKACRCADRSTCPHEWELSDEGAGTIVKSKTKMFWGHKASILGLPRQGIAIDAVALSDGATHDGQTFFPHVANVFGDYPALAGSVQRVLYDSACDDAELKQRFRDELGVELKASFNPRATKPITDSLPRGIQKITPYGAPICDAGYELDYQGIRYANETFIYRAPLNDEGTSVCLSCAQRTSCCNRSSQSGRTITVPFETLAHIDASDPPMAKRFKAIMTRRPSVERMIKRLKCDLGDARLSKRGNEAFQAYLDKTLIGYHLLLRHLH
jgi:hypothetical protein